MIELFLLSYFIACLLLMLYGANCHVMVYLYKRRLKEHIKADHDILKNFYCENSIHDLPFVTTQIPIYNELNVADRIIDAVSAFDYPKEKHDIQVLDDSTDETVDIIAEKIRSLQNSGIQIQHIRRPKRQGFKAGALRYGLERARGQFFAIFDADFVPPKNFLKKSIPYFMMDPSLALVQARWGHLNDEKSLITKLQSIGINGHFMVEQSARSWNGLFMNFNGTAGVFRKTAIEAAGNWQDDTLTEDMDLSYRMQLAGWKCRYLLGLVARAEIPENINAFKSQQFRWAKGSIQTAMKLLPLVWRSNFRFFCKLEATFHMTHYIIHPLMAYLAVMAPVLLLTTHVEIPFVVLIAFAVILIVASTGPSRLYWVAERSISEGGVKKLVLLPILIAFGCGLAVSNTRAVLEAILGKKTEFVRTPKRGSFVKKHYGPSISVFFVLEIVIRSDRHFGMKQALALLNRTHVMHVVLRKSFACYFLSAQSVIPGLPLLRTVQSKRI